MHGRDAHLCLPCAAQFLEPVMHPFVVAQGLANMGHHNFARCGQSHALSVAVKQGHPEFFFELDETAVYRRR